MYFICIFRQKEQRNAIWSCLTGTTSIASSTTPMGRCVVTTHGRSCFWNMNLQTIIKRGNNITISASLLKTHSRHNINSSNIGEKLISACSTLYRDAPIPKPVGLSLSRPILRSCCSHTLKCSDTDNRYHAACTLQCL